MRGRRRDRLLHPRPFARWAALAFIAFAVVVQVAGADISVPVDAGEPIAVADTVAVYPPAETAMDESASVTDAVGVFPAASLDAALSIGVADVVAVTPAAAISADETAHVSDDVGVFPAAVVPTDEPVHVADEVAVVPPALVPADEGVHVADDVTVSPSPSIAVAETVTVGDDISVVPGPLVSDDAHIGVADETIVEALLSPTSTSITVGTDPLLRGRDEILHAVVTSVTSPATSGFVTAVEAGTVVAGPVPLLPDGTATLIVHGLTLGTHTLSVEYGGTPLFTSSHATAVVHVYDYSLASAPAQATIQRGGSTTVAVTASLAAGSSTGASTAWLDFTLSGLPSGVTGSFAGTLALPALGTTTLTLNASATAAVGASTLTVAADSGARSLGVGLFVNAPPIAAGGTYNVNEGAHPLLHATATDLDHDTLSYAWDLNADGTFETTGQDVAFSAVDGPAALHPIVRVCDDHGACATATATVNVANVAPTVRITAPADGAIVQARTPVAFAATFTDPGVLDTQTFSWSFGASTLNASYTFPIAGIQTATLTVRDKDGGVGTASVRLVVVDPHAGWVSGDGWIRTAAGRTTFDFDVKYDNDGRLKGDVDLKTPVGKFHAKSLRYLVVVGSTFELDGTGTLDGVGGVSFHLSGIDGRPDRLRVQIGSVYDSGGPLELGDGKLKIHS